MLVTFISINHIHTISLPSKVQGYVLLGDNGGTSKKSSIAIEAQGGEWILKSNRYVKIIDGEEALKSVALRPMMTYYLINEDGDGFIIFTEPDTIDRQTFTKYHVPSNCEIVIGRDDATHIYFDNPFVSGIHARLTCSDKGWVITDLESSNGVYVNENRVSSSKLKLGDTITIMGLKIVIGTNMLAINNPDGKVLVSSNLTKFQAEIFNSESDDDYELADVDYFYRSPRFKREIETATFQIDSPPPSSITEELPLPLVLGSSLAMGAMSMITVANAIMSKNILAICTGGAMLVGSLLMPTITRIYQKNKAKKKEEKRITLYREYLSKVKKDIEETSNIQKKISTQNNINLGECEKRIMNQSSNLWDRTWGQNDFLTVSLGLGEDDLDADIQAVEKRFTIDDDSMMDELYKLCENIKPISDMPITYSLYDNFISGIVGDADARINFAKGLIVKLAAMYSYDEVKFVFIYNPEDEDKLDFVKWLPHTWTDDKSFRFIATNTTEMKELSSYFSGLVETRKGLNETELANTNPYFIFFSFSQALTVRSDVLKQIFSTKENIHMSVVTVFEELRQLPKECSIVIELNGTKGVIYDKNDTTGEKTNFTADLMMSVNPYDISVKLANTYLDIASSKFTLPKTLTFLELFGVGKVEHLNALSRWKENDPTVSLETAVGVDTLGDVFKLDLHEKYHGPHGLVAGMTGSGKSEFIITFILSLAVNYHPDEVAFILIDYKGGGMAKSFENLPHTAGIITNLDGSAIKRSLTSIESELKRRQAIFAEASKKIGESNIDIYKYQKLYREGQVSEPLQHLFIISDEFAELKTSQPEFMAQLVSAARIGRSLGVHLILATQKPSGVVDDQIWSNSKFRVCLKVQDRSDSMDMLKRPEAAELVDTGRFYLQVGYNELFNMGQSAWAGANYQPSDKVVTVKDDSVVVIDRNGRPIKAVAPDNRNTSDSGKKQLDIITDYLQNVAAENNISVRKLWVEPIPGNIYYAELNKKFASLIDVERFVLNPLVGEYDDPVNQRTMPLTVPLSTEGNVIVYGAAGAGKTSFLNAISYSLIKNHTPEEVNLYLLDFASETLRAFAKAPHVGDVILSYEEEKIANLMKMLKRKADERKKLFADYGGDYSSYIKSSGKTLPNIVIMINNYTAFAEMYADHEEMISYLSREGVKYGIYFILTCIGSTGVRFRMQQNFKQAFALQLNDVTEYSGIVGKTEGLFPAKFKGRGLVKTDELYEFQTMFLCDDDVPFGFISNECVSINNEWDGERAESVPILPERVDEDFIAKYYVNSSLKVPVGVNKETFAVTYYDFSKSYLNPIVSNGKESIRFMGDLRSLMTKNYSGETYFITPELSDVTAVEKVVDEVFDLVLKRNNEYKQALNDGVDTPVYENVLVFVSALSSVMNMLEGEEKEKFELILGKGDKKYFINIILSDDISSLGMFSYFPWYKNNISGTDAIWIGDGIGSQYQLTVNGDSSMLRESIGSNYGYVINNSKPTCLKMLCNSAVEDEDE